MRSPKHRTILGRHVRLPLALVAVITAAAVGLSGAIGLLIGSAGGSQILPTVAGVESAEGRPVRSTSASIAVSNLTVAEGVDQPLHLAVGEEAQVHAQVAALADGSSRADAPVRWFSSDRAVLTVEFDRASSQAWRRARRGCTPSFRRLMPRSRRSWSDRPATRVHRTSRHSLIRTSLSRSSSTSLSGWPGNGRAGASRRLPSMSRDAGRCAPSSPTRLRQGDIDRVRVDGRQYQAAAAGGWAVRVWSVGTPAAWDATEMGELRGLIGDEAASVLTDPTVARVAVGLVFDARFSDQLWAGRCRSSFDAVADVAHGVVAGGDRRFGVDHVRCRTGTRRSRHLGDREGLGGARDREPQRMDSRPLGGSQRLGSGTLGTPGRTRSRSESGSRGWCG